MRVDLRLVAHATGAQTKRLDRPVQIVLPLRATQRQALAESRLIDLDDADAGGFQVADLVADRQRQLPRLDLTRLVLTSERPHQHGHRPGEHALHHPVGLLLCIAKPVDGHRLRAAEVAVDHRRLHATRSIALHPAETGERIAIELLGEVLDHVVALRFAVYQYIEADLLLHRHRMADLGLHRLGVIAERQPALLIGLPRQANGRRLRERADGRGRERRQVEPRALLFDSRSEYRSTLAVLRLDGIQARLNLRFVDAWRVLTCRLHGTAACQFDHHILVRRLVDGTGQRRHFGAFLHGEGQPAFQFMIEPVLALKVHRAVQQRAGRCQPEAVTQTLGGMPRHLQGLVQVAAPDVAPIDQPQRQHLVGRQPVENQRVLLRRTHQIDMQAVHRQRRRQAEVVLQSAKVGGDQLLQRGPLQQVVGALKGVLPVLRQVEGEDRLVDLHPLDTLRRKPVEHLTIDRQEAFEQLELVETLGSLALELAQPKIG